MNYLCFVCFLVLLIFRHRAKIIQGVVKDLDLGPFPPHSPISLPALYSPFTHLYISKAENWAEFSLPPDICLGKIPRDWRKERLFLFTRPLELAATHLLVGNVPQKSTFLSSAPAESGNRGADRARPHLVKVLFLPTTHTAEQNELSGL